MAFNGKTKTRATPIQVSIITIIERAEERKIWLANPWNRIGGSLTLCTSME
jgi:hypothetical protein